MHNVAETLNDHELVNRDGAGLGDTREVVACQVDEHEVLGAFFLIGEQLLGQGHVFLAGCAARAGAGDRVGAGDAVFEGNERLRRGTDNVERGSLSVVKVEEVHVRRGVGLAQHAVHVECLGVGFGFESA